MKLDEVKTVTIPRDIYEHLLRQSEFLECLKACGVDNWEGYDNAMEMFEVEAE